ncbi:MAG: Ig-like domain-containing protein [Bernardetiaceae bacterium]|nr:Ig-like domain-containing protein [Bernardetiaceae bacterium]
MLLLSENQNSEVTQVLQPRNYTQIYNKLKSILSPNEILLFARPDTYSSITRWSAENYGRSDKFKSYEMLDEEQKDEVADAIAQLRADIGIKLKEHKEFRNIYKDLFLLPSVQDIKVIETETGIQPVFTQWACKSNEVTALEDPLSILINRPRSNRARVLIQAQYADGTLATEKELFIDYRGREMKISTNAKGVYDLGKCLIGTPIAVYDKNENGKLYERNFKVRAEDDTYIVIIPSFADATLKVLDAQDMPLPHVDLIFKQEGNQPLPINSGDSGSLAFENLEVGTTIRIEEADNPKNTQSYKIEAQGNDFIFRIGNAVKITVVDENEKPLAEYPLLVTQKETQDKLSADTEGNINLGGDFKFGENIKVADANKPENEETYLVKDGDNHFVFHIKKQPPFVKVKLIDHKNEPIPATNIAFNYSAGLKEATTDEQGVILLPYESFQNKEKVKALVHLKQTNKKGKTKERKVKKSFKFKAQQLEYVIKIKKRRFPWWLLLLLLPLLLLIRCEKTVLVKAVNKDSGEVVENLNTYFRYNQAFAYDAGAFFTDNSVTRSEQTNAEGVATYVKLQYSLYSYLFHAQSLAIITGDAKGCYGVDTLTREFHKIKDQEMLELSLIPRFIDLDFKVIDKEDSEPMPDVLVEIITEVGGKQYKDSTRSGADGRLLFSVPKCGKLLEIRAETDGYFPDSIQNKAIDDLLGGIDEHRTLKLKPIKTPITFFVTDCRDNSPIPGATVTIELDFSGRKSTVTSRTNVNGVGKGSYEEAYLIADVKLSARKQYYKPGRLPNTYQVREFIELPKDKRTICLEPEENPIEFMTIDGGTRQPLAGVKNIVTIRKGNETRTEEIISNANGKFTVAGIVIGDVISVHSSLPPDYEDNNTKVQNREGIPLMNAPMDERTIPLLPSEFELTFRTINAEGGALVPGVSLGVNVNGNMVAPNSSGNGTFSVKVKRNDRISIRASKSCYAMNNTSINNRPVIDLAEGNQSVRDIPMRQQIQVEITKCYNPGRPHYTLFVDDRRIGEFSTTSGSRDANGSDGPQGQSATFDLNLSSGRHRFKFVRTGEYGSPLCTGLLGMASCTNFRIRCLNITKTFPNRREFVFDIDIP